MSAFTAHTECSQRFAQLPFTSALERFTGQLAHANLEQTLKLFLKDWEMVNYLAPGADEFFRTAAGILPLSVRLGHLSGIKISGLLVSSAKKKLGKIIQDSGHSHGDGC